MWPSDARATVRGAAAGVSRSVCGGGAGGAGGAWTLVVWRLWAGQARVVSGLPLGLTGREAAGGQRYTECFERCEHTNTPGNCLARATEPCLAEAAPQRDTDHRSDSLSLTDAFPAALSQPSGTILGGQGRRAGA